MYYTYYLFITYIVTSKPKRISVALGVVHIVFSPFSYYITQYRGQIHREKHDIPLRLCMRATVRTSYVFDRVTSSKVRACVREAQEKPFLMESLRFWFD